MRRVHAMMCSLALPGRRVPGTTRLVRWARALVVLIAAVCTAQCALVRVTPLSRVEPNDNRSAAGVVERDTLHVALVVRMAEWRPEADSGPAIAVAALAEEGKAPQIPAPLIRVREGAAIAVTVRNALRDSTIRLVGLGTRPSSGHDTLVLTPGESKQVRFATGSPGTYLYRAIIGKHDPDKDDEREQAAGAFVVDPPGGSPPDRVFVLNIWGETKDSVTYRNALTINGRSWPWTERIAATVGDTMRWRVINATVRPHPMHLHGAFFRVEHTGDGFADSALTPRARRLVVTEVMPPMHTMAIAWAPVREGRWLFHCHIAFHVIPTAARVNPAAHGGHDENSTDPLEHMAGLVLGIDARLPPGARAPARGAARRLDLFVQQGARRGRSARPLAFVLQRGATPPAADSVEIPGSTLVLTRDEPTDVLVHNRLREPASIHWHGLELESFSDGVAGWSGSDRRTAPFVAPNDTFRVHLSTPRAGTFIYHTHLRDEEQISSGLYGAIVVLEPGRRLDPRTDHLFVVGWDGAGAKVHQLVNGDSVSSLPLEMRAGEP